MKRSIGMSLVAVVAAGAGIYWLQADPESLAATAQRASPTRKPTPGLAQPKVPLIDAKPAARPIAEAVAAPLYDQRQEEEDPAPVPPEQMLNAEGLAAVLQLMEAGVRIQDSPAYMRFLEQAAAAPQDALALFRRELEATPASDIALRSGLFGIMSEVTLAIAGSGAQTDSFVQGAWGLIEQQVHSASKVSASTKSLTYEQMEELAHQGPYLLENGRLYANTFHTKYMAVAVLKDAHSELGRRYLGQIASNAQVDPLIRRVAALHATEQGSMQRR